MDHLTHCFSKLQNFRARNTQGYTVSDIFSLLLLSVIDGADSLKSIDRWVHKRPSWIRSLISLPTTAPSYETLSRTFNLVNREEFASIFQQWTLYVEEQSKGELIALSDIALQDWVYSWDKPHVLMMAWAHPNQAEVSLGQREETEIPPLLQRLCFYGCILPSTNIQRKEMMSP